MGTHDAISAQTAASSLIRACVSSLAAAIFPSNTSDCHSASASATRAGTSIPSRQLVVRSVICGVVRPR
ncbi:MAG: hypothetical protein B7X55_08840 [Rhodobacterales bacterium 34-62-10]|nr:MAG: hypothetical protein B7X55_08840 [Rhodobacterales bacterium 34-62-10]